jgi:5-formyltetrahydrofolate cyclo-ligase
MNDIVVAKAELRVEFRRRLAELTLGERDRAAGRIHEQVWSRPEWRDARAVMLFVPLPDELNILPLLNAAIHHHKTLVLPRFNQETGWQGQAEEDLLLHREQDQVHRLQG